MKYPNLFSPVKIGSIVLKNRISMPAMFTKYANADGSVNPRVIRYLEERARNGVGLIILENTCVDWDFGRAPGNPITIHHDRFIPQLSELVETVHRHDVMIMPELHHAGRQQTRDNIDGRQPVAPSAIQSKVGGDMPREMTEEDIADAINHFVQGARRARMAGFDGVELHGAHGYLIASFISPLTNKRQDRWGGSLENRCRFAVEVIKAIRQEVGKNFPILFRMSGEEWTPGSLTLNESVIYAQAIETAGADAIDVSGGYYESIVGSPMQGQPLDRMVYMGATIRQAVKIPVISCGSMGFAPELAENLIASGTVDILHFGRALLADPELPAKLQNEAEDEIRHCIRCNECLGSLDKGIGIRCAVNPRLGQEYQEKPEPPQAKKRIVVVGAGPCGLEYAVIAAGRGHRVTIIERNGYVGGLTYAAGVSSYKRPEIWGLLAYYLTMCKKFGIEIILNTEATLDILSAYKPDQVILATGSIALPLSIPGSEHLKNAVNVLLSDAAGIGEKVVIIGGSGVGIDLALFLADQGKEVTVLEMMPQIAAELNAYLRMHLEETAANRGIKIVTCCRAKEIGIDQVIATRDGVEMTFPCDHSISAVGFLRNSDCMLTDALAKKGIAVKCLGPNTGAGHIMEATRKGYLQACAD